MRALMLSKQSRVSLKKMRTVKFLIVLFYNHQKAAIFRFIIKNELAKKEKKPGKYNSSFKYCLTVQHK